MQHRAGAGELAHQPSGAARVIEVHVGQQDVVDGVAGDAELGERRQQIRHRVVGADVDEGGASRVFDEVRRRVARIQILGIDRADAVRVAVDRRLDGSV